MSDYLEIINRPHIYIDYETNMAGNIYLLGYQLNEQFQQKIMDTRLQGLANSMNLEIIDPVQGTFEILKLAIETNSIIVAYSEAERNIFKTLSAHHHNTNSYKDIPYLNLLHATKKWINKCYKTEFNALPPFRRNLNDYQARTLRRALCSVMRLTDFQAPKDYAPGKTTQRFETVAAALLLRENNYSKLTRVQKTKATKALKHNQFDVEALPVLFDAIKRDSEDCFKKSIKDCF